MAQMYEDPGPDLENLKARASEKKAENRRFFKKLRQRPPKDLDQVARQAHEAVFAQTDCLECANCCKTTGPLFTQTDIARIAASLRMKPGAFIGTYLRLDEEGDYVLQSVPCPFLGPDHYCSIYPDRPKACREYPHTDRRKIHQIGELTVRNTAICPAAFRIVEAMKARLPQYR